MRCVRFPLVIALIALMPTLALAYTLGPGDDVAIEVRTAQEQLSLRMIVSVDGRIYISPAGSLIAVGKTPAELEADIARELGKYYVGPVQAAVLVAQPKQVKVLVLGQVMQPGEVKLADERPVLSQAIAQAGGPLPQAVAQAGVLLPQASMRRVSLKRGGQELGPVDLYAIFKLGRSDMDVALQPGDVIYVPARERWVTMTGPVQQPGIYELLPGDKLSSLVRMAGGLAADADEGRAVIVRQAAGESRTLEVNLRAALAEPAGADDPALEPSDIVRLASRATQVYVLGQVVEPGAKPYDDNRTLLDYVGLAGGTTIRATRHQVAVVHPGTPEPTVTPVDLGALMQGRSRTPPPRVQPGDIIFIPERRFATVQDWGSLGQILTGIVATTRIF